MDFLVWVMPILKDGLKRCSIQQVQAVLLLLGGRAVPTGVPTVEVSYDQNTRVMHGFMLIRPISIHLLCLCSYAHVLPSTFFRVWVTPQSVQIFHEE